ncbi:type VII secretion protein EccB [Mycobacteroides abscessus]|nr:type VII secretion protein EccB [Mycobacteroides abscessus]
MTTPGANVPQQVGPTADGQSQRPAGAPPPPPIRVQQETPQRARTLTNRIQVSGWRFQFHRLEHGLLRGETSMKHDPMRKQSRSMGVGIAIAALICAGCVIGSLLSPRGQIKDHVILADKDSNALYVRINGDLHPVLNLTSAQLIAGKAEAPTVVRSSELAALPPAPLVGIPGAPERIPLPDPKVTEASWTVCDTAAAAGQLKLTVVTGPVFTDDSIGALPDGKAVLARFGDETDLIYNGHRTPIDLADKSVTLAVGLDTSSPPPVPLSRGLHDALVPTPQLVVPVIPAAGTPFPPEWPLPPQTVIGSLIKVRQVDGSEDQLYVVLPDGLQRISHVTAAILRNADPNAPAQPTEVPASALPSIPQSTALDIGFHPTKPLKLVDPVANPVLCQSWVMDRQDPQARITLLSGRALPLPPDQRSRTTTLITKDPNGTTADNVYVRAGTGWLVQISGGVPAAPTAESSWWISDKGIRFGLADSGNAADASPQKSLGLTMPPLPIPWPVLKLLPQGLPLSRDDALLGHDGLQPDGQPRAVIESKPN